MPARYPRGRRERGNIFIAPSERSKRKQNRDASRTSERRSEARSARRREVELRVIEKPVVHPDRRFISLVHARRYTGGASLLLSRPSTYSHRTVARRLLSRSHLPHVGIRRTRKSSRGEEKRGARRADARRGRAQREETRGGWEEGGKKKDRTQQCPRRCILARLPTRGAEGAPLNWLRKPWAL